MKNKRIYLFFLAFLFLAGFTQAQVGKTEVCNVIDWVRNILLLIVVAMVIFSGYQIMTGTGDARALEDAKKRLLFSLVGGAVIYSAKLIANNFFGTTCS